MEKKEYKTIDEQIEILIQNKNIDPETIDKNVFNTETYISLITPYTDLVAIGRAKDNNYHIYNENTDFKEYLSWAKVDKYISIILQNAIGTFEKKLKLFLETTICSWMFSNGDKSCCDYTGWGNYINSLPYLNFTNIYEIEKNTSELEFATTSIKNSRKSAIENIIKINAGEIRQTNLVKHYREKKYLPFWITIHELTINELFQLFSMIKYMDKQAFVCEILNKEAKDVSFNDVHKFESKLAYITEIRNKINHYESIIPLFIKTSPNLYNIIYGAIKIVCNFYKNNRPISLSMNKPVILTVKNNFNKNSYDKVTKILDLIENSII